MLGNKSARSDKLTNLDISTHYREVAFCLMKSDFLGAFAYWATSQSPYDTPDITDALDEFNKYISVFIFKEEQVIELTYDKLNTLISEAVFETLPRIEKLNHPKIDTGSTYMFVSRYHTPKSDYDFIDLGALARNIKFMIMREYITQVYEGKGHAG